MINVYFLLLELSSLTVKQEYWALFHGTITAIKFNATENFHHKHHRVESEFISLVTQVWIIHLQALLLMRAVWTWKTPKSSKEIRHNISRMKKMRVNFLPALYNPSKSYFTLTSTNLGLFYKLLEKLLIPPMHKVLVIMDKGNKRWFWWLLSGWFYFYFPLFTPLCYWIKKWRNHELKRNIR